MARLLAIIFFLLTTAHVSADIDVPMYKTSKRGIGQSVGNVHISESKYGLLFTPALYDLKPGIHGFHIHIFPSCGENGMAAGGHFDPKNTGKHLGPYNNLGHLGDLPALYVNSNDTATLPVLAPRIKHIGDIVNRALMVHEGGDNYSDQPAKLGGGAARMECGIIQMSDPLK